jgi:antitoxin ParD1/3/4
MNVSLTKRQKEYVQEKVRSGNYQSASEVVREALRVLETLETENSWLEEQILEGINSGPGIPITKSYWTKVRARLRRERKERQRVAA